MKIAINRPGAIGDVLMAFNFLKELEKDNDVYFFCHQSIHNVLKKFVQKNNIVKHFLTTEQYNPLDYDKNINLIGYSLNDGYPYKKMQKHLLEYFADEMGCSFTFDNLKLELPALPKKIKNQNTPRYITFQNKTGWSAYKEWWGWQDLVNILKQNHPEVQIYQIGGPNDPQINNIDGSFCGDSFYNNVAAQAWSLGHIGLDSVFEVTTNIQWINKGRIPGVILFGSTQVDATGYPFNTNICLNLPCQPCFREDPKISQMPLGPCINPAGQTYDNPKHACMAGITPEIVYLNALKLLK